MHRKPYHKLAMGGTFDHFHAGHQHFIDFAAQLSDQLIIGLTTNKLLQGKKLAQQIEDFHARKRNIIHYCKKNNFQCLIVPLDNPYGPTIDREEKIGALAVTEYTTSGAKAINDLRLIMGMRSLPVHVCPMLKDKTGQVISSTRIRSGEINRKGDVYLSLFSQNIKISDNIRSTLSQPQGELVASVKTSFHKIILVGDTTLRIALTKKWKFDLAIFDAKEKRQEIDLLVNKNQIDLQVINPAGQITTQLADSVNQAINKNLKYLFVEGEEDLATLVAVLLAPLGSYVYYGQPDQGLVEVHVTEAVKKKFSIILSQNN